MRKTRFALALAPALLGALALAPGAQARVTVTTGRATTVHGSVARLGVKTALPFNKGARHRPHVAGAARRAAVAPPRIASSAVTAAAAPKIGPNFNGTSSLDSENTNFLQEFEPPDQGLCTGNGFVVDMTNSAYTIYSSTNGAKRLGPFNINDPFNEGAREFTSDPRCYFDPKTNTWFATILFINDASDASTLDIAVNTSGDPRTVWRDYHIDTTNAHAPAKFDCPCFGDQPRLGIDSQNLYVTTDDFSILGPEFNGVSVYAIAKQDLVNGVDAPHFAHFSQLTERDGSPAFGVQPAITTGNPNAEFFLSSLDPNFTGDNRLDVWAMTNRGAVALGKKPTLSGPLTIASEAYFLPFPPADQKGSDAQLDSGDDRMQQVQYINGHIWGELGSEVSIPGDPSRRNGAAWFDLAAGTGGNLAGTRVARQGYVGLKGHDIIYPSVQQLPNRNAVMAFTLTAKSRYPSTAFAALAPGATAFGPVTVTANGSGPYNDASGFFRWGDYSFSIIDPNGTGVWSAAEYVPPLSSQTTDRDRNWGTRVWKVTP